MASYEELYQIAAEDSATRYKVRVACVDHAVAILADKGSYSAEEIAWAGQTLDTPEATAGSVLNAVLVLNKAATAAQIRQASDVAILANVVTVISGRYGA